MRLNNSFDFIGSRPLLRIPESALFLLNRIKSTENVAGESENGSREYELCEEIGLPDPWHLVGAISYL